MAVKMPKKKVSRSTDLLDYSVAIFGPKGAGKTVLAASWPNSIVARFERGRQNVDILQIPQDKKKILTWDKGSGETNFMECLEAFCEDDDLQFIVIDSVDAAYQRCTESVCERFGVKDPGSAGRESASVWTAIKCEFEAVWGTVIECGKRCIFLSHSKTRKRIDPLALQCDEEIVDLSISGSGGNIIKEMTDLVWYVQAHGKHRLLTVRSEDHSEIKTQVRGQMMARDTGLPLYQFRLPHVPTDGDPALFARVLRAWENDVPEYDLDKTIEEEDKAKNPPKTKNTKGLSPAKESPAKTMLPKKRSLL